MIPLSDTIMQLASNEAEIAPQPNKVAAYRIEKPDSALNGIYFFHALPAIQGVEAPAYFLYNHLPDIPDDCIPFVGWVDFTNKVIVE